jgi:glucose-1-phosphate cytidylyltransferase
MSTYAAHGYREFVVACGYRGELVKAYFASLSLHTSDYLISLKDGTRSLLNNGCPDWRVWLMDTGLDTMTGGRLLRLRTLLGNEPFMMTYGDGLADVDINALAAFHRNHGRTATVTAVRPPARFGALVLDGGDGVHAFSEKPQAGEGWINGGFFVFQPDIFDRLTDDQTILEREPLERLALDGQLMAFRHSGFFQPMDTLRDKQLLESLWANGTAPWRIRT